MPRQRLMFSSMPPNARATPFNARITGSAAIGSSAMARTAEDALTEDMVGRIADAAGGGLSLLERRLLLAGGLLGLLIHKLQLGLLIPVALLAGQHWRASEGLAVFLGERDVAYWHFSDMPRQPDEVR